MHLPAAQSILNTSAGLQKLILAFTTYSEGAHFAICLDNFTRPLDRRREKCLFWEYYEFTSSRIDTGCPGHLEGPYQSFGA